MVILVACAGICSSEESMGALDLNSGGFKTATFGGGCFWCMVKPFDRYPGVVEVVSGYTGGHTKDPTYEEVCSGKTGHLEAVQITYDPNKISYQQLLDIFWRQIDPTDAGGQFHDRGEQYTTAIFYHDEEQKESAEGSKQKIADSRKYNKPIATRIIKASEFFKAEEYHQDYYKRDPLRYETYRRLSGRDSYLKKIWGEEPVHPKE